MDNVTLRKSGRARALAPNQKLQKLHKLLVTVHMIINHFEPKNYNYFVNKSHVMLLKSQHSNVCFKNFQKHITDKTANKSIFINNFIK